MLSPFSIREACDSSKKVDVQKCMQKKNELEICHRKTKADFIFERQNTPKKIVQKKWNF